MSLFTRATDLLKAVKEGDLERVTRLLRRRVNPNARGERGLTALHHAAALGHVAIVERLLEAGADPHLLGLKGRTALHEAAQEGQVAIAERLLAAGAHVDALFGQCPNETRYPLELAVSCCYVVGGLFGSADRKRNL